MNKIENYLENSLYFKCDYVGMKSEVVDFKVYRISLKSLITNQEVSFDYFQGTGIAKEPEASDVVYSIWMDSRSVGDNKDSLEEFEEFMNNFEFPDFKEAKRIFLACHINKIKFEKLGLNSEILEKIFENY